VPATGSDSDGTKAALAFCERQSHIGFLLRRVCCRAMSLSASSIGALGGDLKWLRLIVRASAPLTGHAERCRIG